jgi:hypothetical protein
MNSINLWKFGPERQDTAMWFAKERRATLAEHPQMLNSAGSHDSSGRQSARDASIWQLS